MKTSPILKDVWWVKDELAREAGYDVRRLCENTRKWAAEHPHNGPVVGSAAELRKVLIEQREKEASDVLAIKEEPPKTCE